MKSSGLIRLSLVGERSEVRRKEGRKGGMKGEGKGGEESSCILSVLSRVVLSYLSLTWKQRRSHIEGNCTQKKHTNINIFDTLP